MKIYLAGSIAGGRDFEEGVKAINAVLSKLGHEVVTPFVVDQEINSKRFPDLTGSVRSQAIFTEDLELVEKADVIIAEVSQPSTGVGIELGFTLAFARLLGTRKPTLLLRHDSLQDVRNSSLVEGNTYAEFCHYNSETLEAIVGGFFENIGREGRVHRERE